MTTIRRIIKSLLLVSMAALAVLAAAPALTASAST